MRTLALLLATSTLVIVSGSAAAPATGPAKAQIRLVETSSQPRPAGGRLVHYAILQRAEPLPAISGGDPVPAKLVALPDDVELFYEQIPDGWVPLGTITVEQYGPHGRAAGVAAATSSVASDASPAPAPLTLALAPVRPDPVRGRALVVDVALPSADPARLELMDVLGRRIAARELGSLGAGRHSVDLGAGQRFAPGVYLLRLTQGAEARVARVTVID